MARPAALLALLLAPLLAHARDIDQDEALHLRHAGAIQPLEQLKRAMLVRHPGARLLETELDEDDGVYRYEIELLTAGGQVRELELDARSGRILKDAIDD